MPSARIVRVYGLAALVLVVASCVPPPRDDDSSVALPPTTPAGAPSGNPLRNTQMSIFFGGSHEWLPCDEALSAGVQGGRSTPGGFGHGSPFRVGDVLFACGDLDLVSDTTTVTLSGPGGLRRSGRLADVFPYQVDTDAVGSWTWKAVEQGQTQPVENGKFVVRTRANPSAFGVGTEMGIPGFNFTLPDYDEFMLSGFASNAAAELFVYRMSTECIPPEGGPPCGTVLNPNTRTYTYEATLTTPLDAAGQGHFREPVSLAQGSYCFLLTAPPDADSPVECEKHMFVI